MNTPRKSPQRAKNACPECHAKMWACKRDGKPTFECTRCSHIERRDV